MIFIIAIIVVLLVICYSRGRTLKQRARINWRGTKMVLLFPTHTLFAVALVALMFYINTTFSLPPIVDSGMLVVSISSLFFVSILVYEYWIGLWKEIEEISKEKIEVPSK